MKNIIALGLLCLYGSAWAQTHNEKITKELSFEVKNSSNALIVENVNGSITVEGYAGSTIQVEVEKIINGKTEARLQKGIKDVQLGVIDRADTIILYVKGICMSFGRLKEKYSRDGSSWGYDWNECNDDSEREEYDYIMNFRIKLPSSVNLRVSTINEGKISVSKTTGRVAAYNINGDITLTELSQAARANTINGDLDVKYSTNPSSDCRFYTLNGDINAYFQRGLSSNVSFKSFNGEFYTNLPELVELPSEIEKSKTDKGFKYKINGNRFKTGKGGALLDFETFNGNVYLREQ
jgi:DUF4097 and DUF4098 domain-containing protein YvlB